MRLTNAISLLFLLVLSPSTGFLSPDVALKTRLWRKTDLFADSGDINNDAQRIGETATPKLEAGQGEDQDDDEDEEGVTMFFAIKEGTRESEIVEEAAKAAKEAGLNFLSNVVVSSFPLVLS